jgi:hypothetical protein
MEHAANKLFKKKAHSISYLLFFHGNGGYTSAPQYFVARTLLVLLVSRCLAAAVHSNEIHLEKCISYLNLRRHQTLK